MSPAADVSVNRPFLDVDPPLLSERPVNIRRKKIIGRSWNLRTRRRQEDLSKGIKTGQRGVNAALEEERGQDRRLIGEDRYDRDGIAPWRR